MGLGSGILIFLSRQTRSQPAESFLPAAGAAGRFAFLEQLESLDLPPKPLRPVNHHRLGLFFAARFFAAAACFLPAAVYGYFFPLTVGMTCLLCFFQSDRQIVRSASVLGVWASGVALQPPRISTCVDPWPLTVRSTTRGRVMPPGPPRPGSAGSCFFISTCSRNPAAGSHGPARCSSTPRGSLCRQIRCIHPVSRGRIQSPPSERRRASLAALAGPGDT